MNEQGLVIVNFRITPRNRAAGDPIHVRECVRMIDRHDLLAERLPYNQLIEVAGGLGTDIQAFGYEPQPNIPAVSGEDDVWCLFPQDLYLDTGEKPFATLHWKHTLTNIRLLDLIPGVGARAVDISP